MTREVRHAGLPPSNVVPQQQSFRGKPLVEKRELRSNQQTGEGGPLDPATSYGAMLAETQDGDTSEALAAALGGNRRKSADEKDAQSASAPRRETPQSNAQADTQRELANHLAGLHNQQQAHHAGGQNAITDARSPQPQSIKSAHDQLMLICSQMRSSEAATHISYQAFMRLTKIFASDNWMRNVHCTEALLRMQMASGIGARS